MKVRIKTPIVLIIFGTILQINPIPANAENDVKDEIIARCRAQMGDYGSALVKACVDQDIEALIALGKYPDKYSEIIARCLRDMKEYGYALVKACADQDIEAEEALSKY